MKAQRGKIILLCLCLIFAMLIISGKASKLGTYLYVRCNYTHLEEFAAEVIQTGGLSLMTDTRGEMFVIILNAG